MYLVVSALDTTDLVTAIELLSLKRNKLVNTGRLPFTRSIRVEILSKSQNVLVSVGKLKNNRKSALIKPIACHSEMFQMEWYVKFDFPPEFLGLPCKW